MPHRIFISYARVNDLPDPGDEKGWVSTFVDFLNARLPGRVGGQAVEIWKDDWLAGKEPVTKALQASVTPRSVFIMMLSEPYLASAWCSDRELLQFLSENFLPGRIFLVELEKIDRGRFPEPLRDVLGYRFWSEDSQSKRVHLLKGVPMKFADEQFYQMLHLLVQDLAKVIREPYLFVAYAHEDSRLVEPIVSGLNRMGIDTWMDITDLQPGQTWQVAIRDALEGAIGMLVFVSQASMKSEYIRREVEAAAGGTEYLIIPVILEQAADLPEVLRTRPGLDLTRTMDVERAVAAVAEAVRHASTRKPETLRRISADEAQEVAAQVADEVRGEKVEEEAAPDAVFLVHGRDLLLLNEVVSYLEAQGVRTVVLSKISGAEQSLFQKFLKWVEKRGSRSFSSPLMISEQCGFSTSMRGLGRKHFSSERDKTSSSNWVFSTDGLVGRMCSHYISLLMKYFPTSNFHRT